MIAAMKRLTKESLDMEDGKAASVLKNNQSVMLSKQR